MTEKVVSIKANQHDSYTTYTLLAILIPVIGLLLGVVFMGKDDKTDRKLGEHLLAVSVLFMIVWGGLLAFLAFHNSAGGPAYTSSY